jgi:transposase-like protein
MIRSGDKRDGEQKAVTTDPLRSYRAAMNELNVAEKQEIGRWSRNRWRTPTCRSDDQSEPG